MESRQLEQQETPNKRMKLGNKRVHFQEEVNTAEHERLPLHEAARLWYCHGELKAIHKEIFLNLMESKTGNLRDAFSERGLEEIRKRKPHKRQLRRDEYISSVVALYRKQREVDAVCPEEIQRFAMSQSRSAKLRAQHYAALDAEEAGVVFQEAPVRPRTTTKEHQSCEPNRRVPLPASVARNQDSIARSA